MKKFSHPSHLYVGSPNDTTQAIISHIQSVICKAQGCLSCNTCQEIINRVHYQVIWLEPHATSYTLSQFDQIIYDSSYLLDQQEHKFFIITQAERLNQSSANTLLKVIEEPTQGYYFLFSTINKNLILPTIRSRCLIHTIKPTNPSQFSDIFNWLYTLNFPSSIDFLKDLDQQAPKEHESIYLIEQALHYWIKKGIKETNSSTRLIIFILEKALHYPPMPGSSKIFWKNIWLQMTLAAENKTD